MIDLLARAQALLEIDSVRIGVRVTLIVLAGVLAARIVRRRLPLSKLHPQHELLAHRALGALIYGLTLAWALSEAGLNLGVVLGAAGVLTIAVGFAAQTSVSNLISGLFLMIEQPFQIADAIRVGATTGEVLAIDLLSTKLRTFDNLYVRIPNETMLKAEVTNFSQFPIRRFDLKIGVAYKEDLGVVWKVLNEVAAQNPLCLEEPAPVIVILGYGESAVDLQLSVWAAKENFLELRNSMHLLVKQAFEERRIEIPFPHRAICTGSSTAPLPVYLLDRDAPPSPGQSGHRPASRPQ